jgi:hypothetical protein
MPSAGDVTITVLYADNSTETFLVAAADAAGIVKGDVVIKFKGKKTSGTPDGAAKDYELTRAQIKRIDYVTA